MQKRIVSIFFSLTFSLLITAPTIISAVESTFDVSLFFSITEEESNENETTKKLEIKFVQLHRDSEIVYTSEKRNAFVYDSKSYPILYLKLHSPPPEHV